MSEMTVMQKQSLDFLNGNIKLIYKKYLAAAFGSSLISCIYSVVDMAMVGNYKGPEGTAALATAMPVWSILYSLGFLMGIGGSVIFSTIKGRTRNNGATYFIGKTYSLAIGKRLPLAPKAVKSSLS